MADVVVLDLIRASFMEMGVYPPGEVPAAEEAAFGLDKLNRLLDSWSAHRAYIYTSAFLQFTLTPNLSPHTIGLAANSPTWAVTGARPSKITSAQLITNNQSPDIFTPIRIQDADWWAAQATPTLATDWPTDLYYSPGVPNGSLYFWPVPTAAYEVQLQVDQELQQAVSLSTVLILPPGYQDAITYALAVSCLPAGEKSTNGALVALAQRALAMITGNNFQALRIATRDSGIPNDSSNRSNFNYRTGRSI